VVAAGGYAAKGIFVVGGKLALGYGGLAPHLNDAVATAFFRDYGFFSSATILGTMWRSRAFWAGSCRSG
jgi:hypothetical protein